MKRILLVVLVFITTLNAFAQNIFSGEPVQVVGQMNGYSTAASSNSIYRRVSVGSGTPTDGRGQWVKTYNVQSSGGDFTPINMTGGGGNGFLFISGPSGNRFQNKWVFSGTSVASQNAVNAISAYNTGNDMGLNMSTAGRYTFVFNDAGYTATNAKFYVAYTSNAPVTVTRASQTLNFDRSANLGITTSATPSSGENVYVRYTNGTDFTGATTVVQATGSGTSWSATIPSQTIGSTIRYYVFTSTITLASLNGMSEIDKSLSAINYDDNINSNYTYTLASSFTSITTGNFTSSATWGEQPYDGASYTIANTHTVTLNANATISGLTIDSGGTFVASDATPRILTIASGGTIANNGTFTAATGAVAFAATGTVTGIITFNDVTLAGGVNFGTASTINSLTTTSAAALSGTGAVRLIDVLTVSSGTFATNGNLILRSTSTGTARVAPVAGTITGEVTVERYLQGRRAFRFLTPSVTTTTSIRANWQNGGATTANIGTHITGSTSGANGFDTTGTGNASMFTYNAQASGTTSGFTAISNTNVGTLTSGVGYRILIRGDRNVDLAVVSSDNMNVPTTLSANGTLTTGTVTFTSTAGPALINNQEFNTQTNGYTLIGNPYASPVDWHAVTKTGVAANAYYTWDPTLGTSTQRGRYVVYSQDSGTANLLDDNSVLPLGNRQYLQTGQAVFVKNAVLATPATLTFNESNKASNYQYVYRTSDSAVTTSNSSLYLSVYEPNELAIGANAIDGAAALFGTDYATALDANDVEKLVASGENLAFVRANKNLAIETVAPIQANDELFVKTIAFQANKNYTFKVNTQNFDASVSAKMVDLYLNTETPLDVTQPSFVTFITTADVNSYGSDRFKIVFNSSALTNDNFANNTISVYPNPIVNNQFTIALPSSVTGTVNVSMTNMLGQEVYKATSEATPTMQVQPNQPLQEGVYIVSIDNNGSVMQTKVIVKN